MTVSSGSETSTTQPTGFRARLARFVRGAVILLFILTFAAVIQAAVDYFGSRMEGEASDFWHRLRTRLPPWYVWALFAPFISLLVRRFRFEQRVWPVSLAVHTAGMALTILAYSAVLSVIIYLNPPKAAWAKEGYLTVFTIVILYFAGYTSALVYWAIVGVTAALHAQARSRAATLRASRLEAQLAQAQVMALKMQLHPHFLFNTLHAITTLVRTREHDAAVRMLTGLSDLLRYALDHVGEQETTLAEELDFVERYLAIERVRFKDRLDVVFDIEPGALSAVVPSLLLQPIVENAIEHAASARAERTTVRIRAERPNGLIRITIEDDGSGFPDHFSLDNGVGVGLATTRDRLIQLFGDAHTLRCDRSELGGARVTIEMPLIEPQHAEINGDEADASHSNADRR